jgi:hypothetical protein
LYYEIYPNGGCGGRRPLYECVVKIRDENGSWLNQFLFSGVVEVLRGDEEEYRLGRERIELHPLNRVYGFLLVNAYKETHAEPDETVERAYKFCRLVAEGVLTNADEYGRALQQYYDEGVLREALLPWKGALLSAANAN